MEQPNYIRALDEHFCARYSDYVKIAAIEGYAMPEMLYIARDGNIARRDSSYMRLAYQSNAGELLARFKATLADTDFTFSFRFPKLRERMRDLFHPQRKTFARLLPEVLARCGETEKSAGEKLTIEPKYWTKIVQGKLYPEKGTVIALALTCRMQLDDLGALLGACEFTFDHANVRDVVVEYLLVQKIFNPTMRDECLAEYKIENLPIKKN